MGCLRVGCVFLCMLRLLNWDDPLIIIRHVATSIIVKVPFYFHDGRIDVKMMNTFYKEFDWERKEGDGSKDDYRSHFQVDRDRVLHSSAFRRLQSKTQVFWSGEYDFYRTRLTHSLEVAQIGRSICYWLKKDSDQLSDDYWVDPELVEVICLSHDLGHPPFGHAGERSLNDFMRDFGGFEGNAQTLRLLSERIFSNKKGMNPTRAFLDGVLKYKTLRGELWKQDEANGKAPTNHFIYDQQEEHLNLSLIHI